MATDNLKKSVSTSFKMHGLSLQSDANKYMVDVLTPIIGNNERQTWISRIIETVQRQPLQSNIITKEHIKIATLECSENEEQIDDSKVFSIIDAFSMPKFTYNCDRKKFIENSVLNIPSPKLHSGAKSKALLFSERYMILNQMTLRHELFSPAIAGINVAEKSKKFHLYPIEYLLGSTNRLNDLVVLGMISSIENGKYHLEDLTGSMVIDMTGSDFHAGIFTENCFVLAEGSYEDGTFHATAVGFPPIEPTPVTRSYFGNVNFCCHGNETNFKSSLKLETIERDNHNAMMVILSDVWLDRIKVLQKLRMLFSGYSSFPPTCFVLIGDFVSNPHKASNKKIVAACFKQLGDLIAEYPSLLQESKFVFVPGPADLGLKNTLPRPSIPDCVTEDLRRSVPNATFTTNPTRLQYCTQEIIVFRQDLIGKLSRNSVHFPTEENLPNHLVKTILSQAHLCPVPLHSQPIYWDYDHALRLYPLPDVIIYADKADAYNIKMSSTTVVNPGSFSNGNFTFKVYLPASKTVEDSQIVDNYDTA